MSSSAGLQSIVPLRRFVTASGSDGCESTGATMRRSTAIARAKPPVKHIPTTPTPGPPARSCSSAASARNQPITRDVRPVASTVNSRLMHAPAIGRNPFIVFANVLPAVGSRPAVPNRSGTTAEQPSATTRSANPSTIGEMPGISVITMTAGPSPLR